MTWTPKNVAIAAAVAVVALYLIKRQAAETVADVGQAVNPVNPGNVFYGGVNAVGEALTGDESFSLGSWIYDQVHGVDG